MNFKSILIERTDAKEVFGSSGILINNKYVITTGNIIFPALTNEEKQTILNCETGKLTAISKCNLNLNFIWKNENKDRYKVKKMDLFCYFLCKNIKNSSNYIFRKWAIDFNSNEENLAQLLSIFFVFKSKGVKNASLDDFKFCLQEWFKLIVSQNISKGDLILIKSTPFGNRHFINSLSKGIISNILGDNDCLLLSDCPTVHGSEGSPIFLSNENVPFGMVLSSLNWWNGEWLGITLFTDLRSLFIQLIELKVTFPLLKCSNNFKANIKWEILATIENSLFQFYSGTTWGTAILLNKKKGIFLTNSHVIEKHQNNCLYWKNNSWKAKILYKAPETCLDIAIIKVNPKLLKTKVVNNITFASKLNQIGDVVFSAGFPIFPKEANPSPTISQGHISQINEFMIKTTCAVYPGCSGGAILNSNGHFIALIVCNAKLEENQMVYSKINMNIPIKAIQGAVNDFIKKEDVNVFKFLENGDYLKSWNFLVCKL